MRATKTVVSSCVLILCVFLSFSFYSFAGSGDSGKTTKIPVILSTDVGNEIDDQWAIVYTLLSDEFEVLGVMSAHAPTMAPAAAHTSYLILKDIIEERLAMTVHPPILEGASFPLKDTVTPQVSQAATFLVEMSKSFSSENRLNVMTIGAATDIASAILIDPSIANRIRVLQMGFNDWPSGGDFFNILNDIKAAQVIFSSDVPIVVGSAKVCRDNLGLGFEQAKQMVSQRGPIGGWLWDEYSAWYYRFVKPPRKDDFSKPWIIWDTVVVAHLLGFTKNEIYERPKVKDDMSFDHPKSGKAITWITDVDEHHMWADFLKKLDNYQLTHALGSYAHRSRLTSLMP
jgi:inosine-uridine nucleoside N-ribohydrolase